MQESLTNIARHSCASRIEIKLSRLENAINFRIADNGVGIPEAKQNSKKSFGLIGMHERAITLGGTFEINSESGKGTVVNLNFPVQLPVSDLLNESS